VYSHPSIIILFFTGYRQANRQQKLSTSARPHPVVCLHSDRPVSGLVSERLISSSARLPSHASLEHSGHTT